MKMILIVLFLFSNLHYCRNEGARQKEAEMEFWANITDPKGPMLYQMLRILSQQNLRLGEDPDCGGDVIGTLLGLNNDRTKLTKLEENQELTGKEFQLFFQSTSKTVITISLIQVIQADPNKLKDCSKPGLLFISYCNGVYKTLNFRNDSFQLNQDYQFEAKINVKNLVLMTKIRITILCMMKMVI
ncbi:MAG: hypothetical protein EBS19_14540 [Spirochaetia bacterium]|nr:hypothetical protein [Spirochaetia bacterium]